MKRTHSARASSPRILFTLAMFYLMMVSAFAANRTWDGTVGNWNDPTNWASDVIPNSGDIADMNNSGTATLPTTVSGAYQTLRFGATPGGSGAVAITGGILSGATSYLGYNDGSVGSATVTSGTWANSDELHLGYTGSGSLVVNGGFVSSNLSYLGFGGDGSGSAMITSGTWTNSSSLIVGKYGTGSLFVDGGLLSSYGSALGYETGGSGSATVTSGTWSNTGSGGVLWVGVSGSGNLLVNGGLVTSTSGIVGSQPTGDGSVIVTSGTWSNAETVTLGHFGTGSLLIDGGLVTSTDAVLGFDSGGTGSVTVTGEGSTWINSGNLTVGYFGSDNTATIAEGGLIKVGDEIGESITISAFGGTGNFLRFNGGYLALFGDQTAYVAGLIGDGYIQLWDGSEWVEANLTDIAATFYTDDLTGEGEAFAATGYSGLGGYTVVTAVPEPAICALIGFSLAFFFWRKRSA